MTATLLEKASIFAICNLSFVILNGSIGLE